MNNKENPSHDLVINVYHFTFADGSEKRFSVVLNAHSLDIVRKGKHIFPKWAKLDNDKCSICPLDSATNDYCPLAVNMAELIDFFKVFTSCEEVTVTVESQARDYTKKVALQGGVSPLIGIYMVSGGCPIFAKLKPMVRFHLPFATIKETTYRVMSSYLLAQFFLAKHGKKPDWKMKNLSRIYDDIGKVNSSFCKRLRSATIDDASLNAVVILDVFANYVKFSIDNDQTDSIETFFKAYLE
ncbi:MAG: hypothetical protein GY858_07395 [Candidatus Omnitrophica bacterium]|nr:hypothetical protein [Candidatus Omnitrophota bacterium]